MLEENVYRLNEKFNLLMNINENDKKRFNDIVGWCPNLLELSVKERLVRSLHPKKGELWTVAFGQNAGSEVNKTRPALIIQNDDANEKSPTTIVIPITSHCPRFETEVPFAPGDVDLFEEYGTKPEGTLMIEQIRNISKARLGCRIGTLSDDKMADVMKAMQNAFTLI